MRKWVVALVLGAMVLPGCGFYTRTSFSEYRGAAEFAGYGGTVRVVDGIEVWTSGEPNRPYKVLGVIDQSYYNNRSVMAWIAGASRESAVIATAKQYGGDAVMLLSSDSAVTGYKSFGFASGHSTGAFSGYYRHNNYGGSHFGNMFGYGVARTDAISETASRIAVIKYLH